MSSQHDVLRDHITFWVSLNKSYDHGCHLANRFQMSAQEYESLLAAANLAAYTKSGFIMKPNEWGIFLLGRHHFRLSECNIKWEKKKFNIDAMINGTTATQDNRWPFYAVRIGVMSMQSPSKIELQKDRNGLFITPPPQLNKIGIKMQRKLNEGNKRNLVESKTDLVRML